MSEKNTLNNAQKEAVSHKEGALLILAGAGAGKTRVIAHRIRNLIKQGVAPSNILAVTFTNKAAKEMRERVIRLLKEESSALGWRSGTDSPPFVATFHSLGVHILRENARLFGFRRSFTIFDRSDSLRAIKSAMQKNDVSIKSFEPKKILSAISRAKGDATNLFEYSERESGFYPNIVTSVWKSYEEILRSENAFDFDDLLLRTLEMLKKHKEVLLHYREKWGYIHIDEYQDTNRVQYYLANLIAQPLGNICVVGDIDQNVYSWRGSDLQNILSFEERYPNAKVILLEQNYRSTKTILNASNEIIRKNKRRRKKNLFTENSDGEKISLVGLSDETEEARFVAKEAQERISGGMPAREIAVLYRANFQSRALEEAFLAREIPYQVLGIRFFERKEVKDILSFIRAAMNPESLGDMKRIINVPPRGIGKVTFLKMAARREDELSPRAQENVRKFRSLLSVISKNIATLPASRTVASALSLSGLESVLRRGSEDDIEKLENIRELVALATRYDSLPPPQGIEKLLDDAALATDQDELKEERDAVRLMTVHASKGLEFNTVFVTGLEEGLFPHRALSADHQRDEEEERRLFYVAMTRAKSKLFLTHASIRTIFGGREANIPSEFLTDIDEKHLADETDLENGDGGRVIYMD